MRDDKNLSNPVLTAESIIEKFTSSQSDLTSTKESMYKLFWGFFASDDCTNMQTHERSDLAFHFNEVMNLIGSIELLKLSQTDRGIQ